MLDAFDYFLITFKTPMQFGDTTYSRAWGVTHTENHDGIPFVILGGSANEIMVALDNVMFAHPCADRPKDTTIFVAEDDFENIFLPEAA